MYHYLSLARRWQRWHQRLQQRRWRVGGGGSGSFAVLANVCHELVQLVCVLHRHRADLEHLIALIAKVHVPDLERTPDCSLNGESLILSATSLHLRFFFKQTLATSEMLVCFVVYKSQVQPLLTLLRKLSNF